MDILNDTPRREPQDVFLDTDHKISDLTEKKIVDVLEDTNIDISTEFEVTVDEKINNSCYVNAFNTKDSLEKLVVQSGNWSWNKNGFLEVVPTGSQGMIAYLNTNEWTDFEANIDLKLVSPGSTHAAHFFFRYTPNGNPPNNKGYTTWLGNWPGQCMSGGKCSSGNSLYFNAIDFGNAGLFFVPVPFSDSEMSNWHKIGIVAKGTQITTLLDGKEQFTVTDTLHSSGKFGFASVNTPVYFRNLQVCPLDSSQKQSLPYTKDEHCLALWHFDNPNYLMDECNGLKLGDNGTVEVPSQENFKQARYLNGKNYFELGNPNGKESTSLLSPTQGITIEALIKPDSWPISYKGDFGNIIAKADGTPDGKLSGYLLAVGDGIVIGNIGINSGTMIQVTAPITLPTNKFTHLALTYDSKKVKLYIDHNLKNEKDAVGTISNFIPKGFFIGWNYCCGNSFIGAIDEVRISDIARNF